MLVMFPPVTSHVQQLEFWNPGERGAYWVLNGEGSNQVFKNPLHIHRVCVMCQELVRSGE